MLVPGKRKLKMNLNAALKLLEQNRLDTACVLVDTQKAFARFSKELAKARSQGNAPYADQEHAVVTAEHAVTNATHDVARTANSLAVVRTAPNREYAADVQDGLVTWWSRSTVVDTEIVGAWGPWERTFGLPAALGLFSDQWTLRDRLEK